MHPLVLSIGLLLCLCLVCVCVCFFSKHLIKKILPPHSPPPPQYSFNPVWVRELYFPNTCQKKKKGHKITWKLLVEQGKIAFTLNWSKKRRTKTTWERKNNFYIEFVDSNVYMIKQLSFVCHDSIWSSNLFFISKLQVLLLSTKRRTC